MDVPYAAAKAAHQLGDPFSPPLPTSLLGPLAFILLILGFASSFYFTTLPPKGAITGPEIGVALGAATVTGFGVVALFNAVGVHV